MTGISNIKHRRNNTDILAKMLEVAKEGTQKTQIMYKANLSFTQLNEYLPFLIQNDFVEVTVNDGKKTYVTTAKGRKFVQRHLELVRALKT